MTSYIIVSPDQEKGKKEVEILCTQHEIDRIDQTIVEPAPKKDGTISSLGISDVKLMQQKVSLKPIKSTTKAVILPNSQLLTIPAQNALLKLLEEPPEHTLLFLITTQLDTLLPTIRSRCSINKVTIETPSLPDEELKQLQHQATMLQQQSIGDALKMAEQLAKDKEKALSWLIKMITLMREEMIKSRENDSKGTHAATIIRNLQQTHKDLSTTNANPRLLLEHLFLITRY